LEKENYIDGNLILFCGIQLCIELVIKMDFNQVFYKIVFIN